MHFARSNLIFLVPIFLGTFLTIIVYNTSSNSNNTQTKEYDFNPQIIEGITEYRQTQSPKSLINKSSLSKNYK
jgi:hypothetical protein